MKILCISDQIDPLVYTNTIRERFKDIDLVLSAGDLPLDYLEFIVSSLNKPLLFVFGNHNIEQYRYFTTGVSAFSEVFNGTDDWMRYATGAVHISGKVVAENGLIIAGLGGSMRYNKGDNQFTEAEMYFEILKLAPRLLLNRLLHGRCLDILLTHASPRGIHDKSDKCHWGFKAFLWFIKTFKPRYLIHGHIHLYDLADVRTTVFENTLVVNAYSHYIIDTKEQINGTNA